MKLTSILIFLIVLIASGFCADTTTTVNPTTETTTTSAQTTSVTDATSVQTTTVTDPTTVPATSQQPNTTTVSLSTTTNTPTTSSTEPPITTSIKPTTSSTDPPITTTVSPSTATSIPTTSSTVPPITATIKPTTSSTEPPTTTTSSPDTTTSPKPTTVPPSTTTKSPEPPTPVEGSWNVTEGNLTCIRADLKVRFRIPVKDHVKYIVLSPNATSSGSCKSSNTTQELQLEESEYTLTMIFEKDSNNAYLTNVTFTYTLPDSSGIVYNDAKLFTVNVGKSYMCVSSSNIDLKNVTMEVFRIHIQSFGSVGDKDFGPAEECETDKKVNDTVPIEVGIVLMVLVVVVLVAYFVERRRSRQKGYRSV